MIQPTGAVLPRRPSIWELAGRSPLSGFKLLPPFSSLCSVSQSLNFVPAPVDWKTARECGRGLFGLELLAKGEAREPLTLGRPGREVGWRQRSCQTRCP